MKGWAAVPTSIFLTSLILKITWATLGLLRGMHPRLFRVVSPKCIKQLQFTTTDIFSFKQMCLPLLWEAFPQSAWQAVSTVWKFLWWRLPGMPESNNKHSLFTSTLHLDLLSFWISISCVCFGYLAEEVFGKSWKGKCSPERIFPLISEPFKTAGGVKDGEQASNQPLSCREEEGTEFSPSGSVNFQFGESLPHSEGRYNLEVILLQKPSINTPGIPGQMPLLCPHSNYGLFSWWYLYTRLFSPSLQHPFLPKHWAL